MKNNRLRLIIEIVSWTFFLGFPLIVVPTFGPYIESGHVNTVLKGVVITHSMLIVFYYFNYYFALPKFYFTKKYQIYFPLIIGILLLIIAILHSDRNFNPIPQNFKLAELMFIFSIILRFIMLFLLSLGFSTYSRLKQAEEDRLRTELSFLKAQINPHFLFNTLNSIYALTVKKSDAAPQSVTKLSSIMRYVITEATHDFVSLEKEMAYLSAYIDLEKLRLTEKVKLDVEFKGDGAGKKIAPFIFIPLIENAFKHGVSTSENSHIVIKIEIKDTSLTLQTHNTIVGTDKSKSNGLGLENVKRRLNLIYPGRYQLTINENEKEFSVNLALQLHD